MIWHLSNSTRYSAAATLAADRDGRDIWITIVKATFEINPDGAVERAVEQFPVIYTPIFCGDPRRSSLITESDIDYAKPGVDVLVQGNAHAPEGKSVREHIVGLEVDGRRKFLRVHGERVWAKQRDIIVPSDAQPFTELPVVYERAFGGFDPVENGHHDERNPAGCGYARRRNSLIDRLAPQIEYMNDSTDGQNPRPAGFGPIARHWLPRRSLAGTYDKSWSEERFPLLPIDFDERFFLTAPEDQQFSSLSPRATVRLVGMSPNTNIILSFRIPRLAIGINIQLSKGGQVSRRAELRTVLVLPEVRKVVLTFADAMPCTGRKFNIIDAEAVEKKFINNF